MTQHILDVSAKPKRLLRETFPRVPGPLETLIEGYSRTPSIVLIKLSHRLSQFKILANVEVAWSDQNQTWHQSMKSLIVRLSF